MSHESATPPKANSQGQQESTSNSQMDFEKILDSCTNMMIDGLKLENDRHTQSMTTVIAAAFKKLAITIQNSKTLKLGTEETEELNKNQSQNTPKMVTEEDEEQNKNYSQNMHKLVTEETEEQNKSYSQNEVRETFYDTQGKTGLLCILLLEKDWEKANKNDEKVLRELFGKTLGFDVETFTSYDDLENKMDDLTKDTYYCLLICISGHGYENAVITKSETSKTPAGLKKRKILELKTTDSIKYRFSNACITALAGVPKIIILDTCRGSKEDISVAIPSPDTKRKAVTEYLPTTHSDCIIIHATTLGNVAFVPDHGSIGIQGVMKALNANWKTDHLEEILIDARREVAMFNVKGIQKEIRQTLETQSTLTKRLMFVEVKDK